MRVLSGSLRLRFLLPLALWVALGTAAIWFASVRVFAGHVEQSYHEELEVHVRELGRLVMVEPDGRPALSRPLSDPRYEVPLSGFYWQVSIPGRPVLRSPSMTRGLLDGEVAHSPDIYHTTDLGPTGPAITYGYIQQGPSGEEMHIVIATDQAELDRLVDSFMRDLAIWMLTLGSLLLLTGIALIRFGLRPLDRLGTAVARLKRRESATLEGAYPAEIEPLVEDLNTYIRQNEETILRARVQAGNLAHSLRTPLAVITDEAERIAQGAPSAASGEVLLQQSRLMEQQIEYQLARARSAAGRQQSVTDLAEILPPIVTAMQRLHPDIDFVVPDAQSLDGRAIKADPVDMTELLSILLDNAGKWAARQVRLVATREPDGWTAVTIEDDGPGLDAEHLERAFEVGSRFDQSKPGSGLGLAIARDLADAMGARLSLHRRCPGLSAELRLPN